MTTYDIFMHYYNGDIGKSVTNETECTWYSCLTQIKDYDKSNDDLSYLEEKYMDQNKLNKDLESLEVMFISAKEDGGSVVNTENYEKYIIKQTRITNPKYDMIFIWDGMGTYNSKFGESVSVYFDKMKRVPFKPWFFHSKYHSLHAVMNRAEELIDLFGKEHIMIGKEVPLDQYIEIV